MCISYFGGKNRMSEFIYQYIPKDIKNYVEVFSGAMWIYFNEDFSHCDKIVYNDINPFMSNLYKSAKDYNKFLEYYANEKENGFLKPKENIEFKQSYKDLYYEWKKNSFLDDKDFTQPDYDKAVKYLFLITSAFNGCYPRAAGFSGVSGNGKIKAESFINKLNNEYYQNKFSKMTDFENMDFEALIDKYDSEDTFLYLDPPYAASGALDNNDKRLEWYGVDDESVFGRSSHERLAKRLQTTKSKWILSYYPYKELEEWFPKDKYRWVTKEFFRSSASFSDKKSEKGEELLIMNY